MTDRVWKADPDQALFIRREDVDEVLIGGRKGTGKSDALFMFSVVRRRKYPGSKGLILRRRLADLQKEGQLIPRSHEVLDGTGPIWNGQQHKWRFPGGGVIEFGYLQRDEDVYRYQSAQYDDICINQAEQLTGWQVKVLGGALRTTRTDLKPVLRLDANPGGRGHGYLKGRFVDPAAYGQSFHDAKGNTLLYIHQTQPSRYLNPEYQRWLDELPEPLRSAWRDGRWDIFPGQFFRAWDPAVHVCEPFKIPEAWPRWMAYDWGMASPAWWGWFTRAPWGTVYLYRELYVARQEPESERWVGTGETVDAQARRAKALMAPDEHPSVCYSGTDMWERGAQTGETNEAVATRVLGIGFERAMMDRVQGWQRVQRALVKRSVDRAGNTVEEPELQVFGTCTHLIRTLPALVGREEMPEDVDDGQDDHPADGMRYGLSKIWTGAMTRPEFSLIGERESVRESATAPWT